MPTPDYFADLPARYEHLRTTLPPALAEQLAQYGCAPFASDPDTTLRPGRLYVCSLKPYGAAGRTYPNGWDERPDRPGYHRWYDSSSATGNFVREADALLRSTLATMGIADADPRHVFNTYAYPWRAEDSRQLKAYGLDRLGIGDLHRRWLNVVRPEVVLCIGNGPAPSAFVTMCAAAGLSPKHVTTVTPGPRLKVRHGLIGGGPLVIGVPHLSRVRAGQVWGAVEEILTQQQQQQQQQALGG